LLTALLLSSPIKYLNFVCPFLAILPTTTSPHLPFLLQHLLFSPLSPLPLNPKSIRSYQTAKTSNLIPIPSPPGFSKTVHLCLSLSPQSLILRCYSLNGVDLNVINSCSDLGVKSDSVLSFADHIDGIVFKAKQTANQILRCFVSKDKWVLTKAFAVFVRPLLEYCSPVWSPCTVTAIN